MTDWVRLWHDMPTDPKWRTIARKSGQPLVAVIALFNMMLVNASASLDRGTLENWDSEDAATALDIETEAVTAIMAAMQGKVLCGERLSGWEKRQPSDGGNNRGFRGEGAYVYVLRKEGTPEVKLGCSKNPWARASDLQTACPEKITVFATFKGERNDERELHRLLARYRASGEWFNLPEKLLAMLHDATGSDAATLLVATRNYEDTDTESDTDKKESNNPPKGGYEFEGKIIKLKRRDLEQWRRAYPDLDLPARLQSRDDWLASEATDKDRERWFISTSNWLANLQQKARAETRQPVWDGMP